MILYWHASWAITSMAPSYRLLTDNLLRSRVVNARHRRYRGGGGATGGGRVYLRTVSLENMGISCFTP